MVTGKWIRMGFKLGVLIGLAFIAGTFGTSGASAQGFSVAFGREEFVVAPGGTFSGAIPVTNLSDQSLQLKIYTGDWVRMPGQTSGYTFDGVGGREARSLKDWIVYTPERMTLKPGETQEVRFDVDVPDDSSLEGSYWGAFFIENNPPEEPNTEVQEGEGMRVGIRTAFRYAVQIFATIAGTEIRDATFDALDLGAAEGGFDVRATLENLGNVFMRPKVWLELRNTVGEVVFQQEHGEQTLLPESGRDYLFEVRNLSMAPGRYLVMVIADYGVPRLIAAQQTIDIAAGQPGSASREQDEN